MIRRKKENKRRSETRGESELCVSVVMPPGLPPPFWLPQCHRHWLRPGYAGPGERNENKAGRSGGQREAGKGSPQRKGWRKRESAGGFGEGRGWRRAGECFAAGEKGEVERRVVRRRWGVGIYEKSNGPEITPQLPPG